MSVVIGIDGGGSRTRVLAIDAESWGAHYAAAESSNAAAVGTEAALHQIDQAVMECLRALQRSRDQVTAVCAGLAGMGGPSLRHAMTEALGTLYGSAGIYVTTDAEVALTAHWQAQPGTLLIAGTGVIAVSQDAHGHLTRESGYGYLLGDEGSGFAIGQMGLRAALCSSGSGFKQETALTAAARTYVDAALGAEGCTDLEWVSRLYQAPRPVTVIAGFAASVLALWGQGDTAATRIVETAVAAQASLVHRVTRRGDAERRLALAGGLFHSEAMVGLLRTRLTDWQCERLLHPPVSGAASMALAQCGWSLARAVELVTSASRGLCVDG